MMIPLLTKIPVRDFNIEVPNMFKVITMKIYQRAASNSPTVQSSTTPFIILCLFEEPYLAVLDLVSRIFVGAKLRTLYIKKR